MLVCAQGGLDPGNAIEVAGPTAAALALAVLAPAAAFAAWSLRDRAATRTLPALLALACAAGATAWSFASIGWAAAPDLAWLAANRAAIALCVLVVAVAIAARLARPARALALSLSAAAAAPVAWALLTKLAPALGGDRATGRLQEPIGYWNGLALVCAVALPGALVLAGSARRGPGRVVAWRVPLAAAWMVLLAVALVLTLSRSGLVAAALAAGLTLWALPERTRAAAAGLAAVVGAALPAWYALTADALTADEIEAAARGDAGRQLAWRLAAGVLVAAGLAVAADRILARRVPRPGATTAALLAILALAIGLPATGALAQSPDAPSRDRSDALANDPSRLTDTSGNLRERWWGEAVRGWLAAPVAGNGAGGFRLVELRERRDGDDALLTREAHQVVLGTLSATGLVGGALLLGIVAGVGWAGVRALGRRRREALLALAVLAPLALSAQIDWTASIPALAAVAAAGAGVLIALAGPPGRADAPRAEPALAAGLALVAALLVAAALAPWGSERAVASSREALADGDVSRALDRARLAAGLDPVSPLPLWAKAEALAATGRRGDAVAAYLEAAERQPENPATWRRVALAAGSGPLAREAWARARALDPHDARAAAEAGAGG